MIYIYISKGLQCALTAITIVALWQLPHLGHGMCVYIYIYIYIIQIYSGITCGRVLNGELYTCKLYKLINLFGLQAVSWSYDSRGVECNFTKQPVDQIDWLTYTIYMYIYIYITQNNNDRLYILIGAPIVPLKQVWLASLKVLIEWGF